MTEDEAKTKWCPHVRVVLVTKRGGTNHPYNRYFLEDKKDPINNPVDARCIASDCMAWRWFSEDYKGTGGYCGLAGKP